MFCPHCGKPISENGNYCIHCGNQIAADFSKKPLEPSRRRSATIMTQLKLQVTRLTHFDFLLLGMQFLAIVLGLFFPMVQRLLSTGKVDFKIRGIFRSWSYINKQYNYDGGRKLLHNSLQFIGIVFLFVAIFLIGFTLLRKKRTLCALGLTAAYIIYGIVVLRMVGANYYSSPRHEVFTFTPEFWFGAILLAITLILTLGLHRNFKNISRLTQDKLDERVSGSAFIRRKRKETHTMNLKALLIIVGILMLFLVFILSSVR